MFENIINFFRNLGKKEIDDKSKEAAKERLHLVLMQDRANVSADFLELMKQEIIEVIKKYIDIDENEMDVRLTNKTNTDGIACAPALYANIPIMSIKDEAKKVNREIAKKSEESEKRKKDSDKLPALKKTKSNSIINKKQIDPEKLKKTQVTNKLKTTEKLTTKEVKKVAKQMATKVTEAVNTAKNSAIKKKKVAKKETSDEVK